MKADFFNKIVTVIDEHFGDNSKLAVNTLIGVMAKKQNIITQSHFSESVVEAGHFSLLHKSECVQIDNGLYMMYSDVTRYVAETRITIYDMIIDMEKN